MLATRAAWAQALSQPRRHIAQLYHSSAFLAEAVGLFLAEGIRRGEAGLVIATREHAGAIRANLVQHGLDPDALIAADRLELHDAGELMAAFVANGALDRPRAKRAIAAALSSRPTAGASASRTPQVAEPHSSSTCRRDERDQPVDLGYSRGQVPAPRTILIVDDDKDIRETLRELVEQEGFGALAAEHGEHALSVLRGAGELPCVILLDLMMPVMDGFAFREAQLADPVLAGIPVVVMTADGNLEDKRRRIGCEHALEKPMAVQELLDVIAAYS